jgi:hypothetical protein
VAANLVGTQLAAIDNKVPVSLVYPPTIANRSCYALTDRTTLQIGDYLLWEGTTYFVATLGDVQVPTVIRCDRVMTVTRPGAPAAGSGYYGGDLTATETPVLTSWPAAVMEGTKVEKGDTALPGDVRLSMVKMLMPLTAPQIMFADVMMDDLPQPSRYIVSQVVASTLCMQITAYQAVA